MSLLCQKENESDALLLAKIDNANIVLHLLKTINFREAATVYASVNGLKVTVEEAKTLQANAFIQAEFFQEYNVREEMLTFKVNLNVLVECLSIFGSRSGAGITPALKLMYNGTGSPLILLLEESGAVTDCKIVTRDADESLDFNFSNDRVVNKLIMRSECLREVFAELDQSSDLLTIHISSGPPSLRLATAGNYGVVQTDIPGDSEMMETFKCSSPTTHSYKMCLLHTTMKALAAAQKVSLRVDDRGFLCLQFMVKTETNDIAFVEFFAKMNLWDLPRTEGEGPRDSVYVYENAALRRTLPTELPCARAGRRVLF